MLNSLNLIGRLTKDPEMGQIPGKDTETSKFTIAVDRNYKNAEGEYETDFIPCEAIGQSANFINTYLAKGRLVAIEGNLRIDRYQDAEGNNRSFTKCSVNRIQALDSAKTVEGGEVRTETKAVKPSKPGKPGTPKRPKKMPAKASN